MSTLTALASRTNENAISVSPNSNARLGGTRPEATGRELVRFPISGSMSRSSTWLSADAPPHASASPAIAATASPVPGQPRAPAIIPQKPVMSRSDMIRGFVSAT